MRRLFSRCETLSRALALADNQATGSLAVKMPVHIGSAVLITGDTYEKKAKLLAVGRRPTSKGKAAQVAYGYGRHDGLCRPRPASTSLGPR